MDSQKEVLIKKMIVPKTNEGNQSSTQGQSLDFEDELAKVVFQEDETEITVLQVGYHLDTPKFRKPTLDKPIRKLVFERGPILNLKSVFYMAASLSKLEEVHFYFIQSNPKILNGLISFQNIIAKKFISSSVERLYMYVKLPMFRELDEDNKRNLTELITAILDVSPKCFPNLNKIGLELPDDGSLEIYKSLYQFIERAPVLAKAKITTEVDEKRISCYYPVDHSCEQLSLENCSRLYNTKPSKKVLLSSQALILSPQKTEIFTKEEPGSPCPPPNTNSLDPFTLDTVTSTPAPVKPADDVNALVEPEPVKNPESVPVPDIVPRSAPTKPAEAQIRKPVTFQDESTTLSSKPAQISVIITAEVPSKSDPQSESSKPFSSLKTTNRIKSGPSKSAEPKSRELSRLLPMPPRNDVSKRTQPSTSTSTAASTSRSTSSTSSRQTPPKKCPTKTSKSKPSNTNSTTCESNLRRLAAGYGNEKPTQPKPRFSRNRTRGARGNGDPYPYPRPNVPSLMDIPTDSLINPPRGEPRIRSRSRSRRHSPSPDHRRTRDYGYEPPESDSGYTKRSRYDEDLESGYSPNLHQRNHNHESFYEFEQPEADAGCGSVWYGYGRLQ